jgi:TetR/AcrR family transcriptional regulator, transcriptional repressor for nem operon
VEGALTARGLRSRERIVAAAADLFARGGVNGTSVDDVLAAAGASKSQLYHYFANKQALVVAVIERHSSEVMAANAFFIDDARTLDDIERWFAALVAYQQDAGFHGGCPVGSLAAELAEADDAARLATAACFASWRARIAESFGRMRTAGVLRPETDVEALASSTLAAIEGGLLLCKSERSTAALRAVLDATLAYLRSWSATPRRLRA